MKLIVDLDGVICEEKPTFERSLALPLTGAPGALRGLQRKGYTIIIYTARSWSEYEMTKAWLEKWSIPHDQLIMGKPVGDMWIDDRAMEFKGSWEEVWTRLVDS
jgi:hypothetical protein